MKRLKEFFSKRSTKSEVNIIDDEDYIGKNELKDKITNDLIQTSLIEGYKWIKSRDCFELKTQYGNIRLDIEIWSSFDLNRDMECFTVRPSIYLRHNILHEWFSEFSFKTKSDQKNSWSTGFSLQMLGIQNEIQFLPNLKEYKQDLTKLKSGIEQLVKAIQPYIDIKYLYESETKQMIENPNYNFSNSGIEWVFESLILANNYAKNDYLNLKNRLLNHIEIMHNNDEPNLRAYYSKLEQIIDRLEEIKTPNSTYPQEQNLSS